MTVTLTDADMRQRRIPLEGTWNLREVGGYVAADGRRTRPGMLYRSDALHQLDDEGRRQLRALGVRTIVDLRQTAERESDPDLVDGSGARVVHLPLYDQGGVSAGAGTGVTLGDIYRMLVTDRGVAIAAVVRELAVPGALPALVHCTAGKDRTGVVVALVLAAVGIGDDVIVADFSATGLFLSDERRQVLASKVSLAGVDPEGASHLLSAEPELIVGALAVVRERHGSARAYLMAHGVLPGELSRLGRWLVDDGDAADGGAAGSDTVGEAARLAGWAASARAGGADDA